MNKFFQLPRWPIISISFIILIVSALQINSYEEKNFKNKKTYLDKSQNQEEHIFCIGYLKIDKKLSWGVSGKDRRGRIYQFIMNPEKIKLNERYSFKGLVIAKGKIKVIEYYHHPLRVLKYGVSLLSVLLVLYLIWQFIGFDKKQYEFFLQQKDTDVLNLLGKFQPYQTQKNTK